MSTFSQPSFGHSCNPPSGLPGDGGGDYHTPGATPVYISPSIYFLFSVSSKSHKPSLRNKQTSQHEASHHICTLAVGWLHTLFCGSQERPRCSQPLAAPITPPPAAQSPCCPPRPPPPDTVSASATPSNVHDDTLSPPCHLSDVGKVQPSPSPLSE